MRVKKKYLTNQKETKMTEEKEKVVVPFVEGKGLVPNDFDGMYRMSQVMAASGLMPKDLSRPEKVFVALQLGYELGLTPMQSVQSIAVINGRPTIWGDAMLALVMRSGLMENIDEREQGDGDALQYTCIVHRKGFNKPVARTFGIKKAKGAGLMAKDSWKKYPGRMCQMRARSWALRDAFPDVLKGMRSPADVDDGDLLDASSDAIPVTGNDTVVRPAPLPATEKSGVDYGGAPAKAAGLSPADPPADAPVDPPAAPASVAAPTVPPPSHTVTAAPVVPAKTTASKDPTPWHQDNWIRKRGGKPPKSGLYRHIVDNEKTFFGLSEDTQVAVRAKYTAIYGDKPFPIKRPDEANPAPVQSEEVSGGPFPKSASAFDSWEYTGAMSKYIDKVITNGYSADLFAARIDEYCDFAMLDRPAACNVALDGWDSWLKQVVIGFDAATDDPREHVQESPVSPEDDAGKPETHGRLTVVRHQIARIKTIEPVFYKNALNNLVANGVVRDVSVGEFTAEECDAISNEISDLHGLEDSAYI